MKIGAGDVRRFRQQIQQADQAGNAFTVDRLTGAGIALQDGPPAEAPRRLNMACCFGDEYTLSAWSGMLSLLQGEVKNWFGGFAHVARYLRGNGDQRFFDVFIQCETG